MLGGPNGKRDFEISYNTAIDRQKGRFRPPNVVRGTVGSPTIGKRDCETSCEYAKRDFLVLRSGQKGLVGRRALRAGRWKMKSCEDRSFRRRFCFHVRGTVSPGAQSAIQTRCRPWSSVGGMAGDWEARRGTGEDRGMRRGRGRGTAG